MRATGMLKGQKPWQMTTLEGHFTGVRVCMLTISVLKILLTIIIIVLITIIIGVILTIKITIAIIVA